VKRDTDGTLRRTPCTPELHGGTPLIVMVAPGAALDGETDSVMGHPSATAGTDATVQTPPRLRSKLAATSAIVQRGGVAIGEKAERKQRIHA
jgi:hypothetical protein